jgi:hypothetical protein
VARVACLLVPPATRKTATKDTTKEQLKPVL